jgi:3',5'-cyclic AMP phosphodiesterase CpdA
MPVHPLINQRMILIMKSARHRSPNRIGRRRFLAGAAVTMAATATGTLAPFATTRVRAAENAPRRFRFAFLPCIHLRREFGSSEGFATALQSVGRLSPAPDFILTGGDMCQNLRDQSLQDSSAMIDLFLEVLRKNSQLPVRYCLGNHDLAAWNKVAEASGDPRYGKKLSVQKFGMPDRYFSFDQGGWHFVVLDYMRVTMPGKFTAEIDAEQLAWLRDDLGNHRRVPTILVTHAPVVSAVELFSDRATKSEQSLAVPFGRVISNAPELVETARQGNVRAFISGHLHLVERLDLLGFTFVCSGSVSGHQWTGPRMGTPEGYGVFDCEPDGSFTFHYQAYGWEARRA